MNERGKGLLEAPRGFGKSTIGTTTFAIFLILINPDIRILITSSTATKAEGFLQEIKAHFEYNPVLIELFGEYKPSDDRKWSSKEIQVAKRQLIAKEGTIMALGQSGQVVSKHFDVIINDDAVNEDTARTKTRREKLKDWIYTSMMPTLMSDGIVLTTGTRYHPEDLFGYMEKNERIRIKQLQTKKKLGKDTSEEEAELPLRILKLKAIIDEGKSGERSLWPTKFPLAKLKSRKREMGSIRFGGQMQQETDLMKGKIIKDKDIQWYDRDKIDTSKLKIYMGMDLAAGKDVHNDKFALVVKGYDPFTMNGYTLDYVHGQFSFRDQMAIVLWKAGKSIYEIKDLMGYKTLTYEHLEEQIEIHMPERAQPFALRQWKNVIRIGIEGNAYQKVLPDTIVEMWADIPIIKIHTSVDKITRLTTYSPRFENNQEYLADDGSQDEIKDELIAFPDAEHDDIPDAHEICNKVSGYNYHDDDEDEDNEDDGSYVFR